MWVSDLPVDKRLCSINSETYEFFLPRNDFNLKSVSLENSRSDKSRIRKNRLPLKKF